MDYQLIFVILITLAAMATLYIITVYMILKTINAVFGDIVKRYKIVKEPKNRWKEEE